MICDMEGLHMAARHIDTAKLEDAAGKTHVAWKVQHVITSQEMGGAHRTSGSTYWQFPNGRPLNTDDDIEFEDLDGRTYRRENA